MSNRVDLRVDVLARSSEEIGRIETALEEPCDELLAWQPQKGSKDPKEIVGSIKGILAFKPIENLGYIDPSVNKSRRFENSWKGRYWDLVWSHLYLVSEHFPAAIFLAVYWDDQMNFTGKSIIRGGREIRKALDGSRPAQVSEWVLSNIFAPFQTEYDFGLEFGSLWDEWLSRMQAELIELKAHYGKSEDCDQKACTN